MPAFPGVEEVDCVHVPIGPGVGKEMEGMARVARGGVVGFHNSSEEFAQLLGIDGQAV